MLFSLKQVDPSTALSSFIAPTATLIGEVNIAQDASVWFGAVLRADEGTITVGRGTNIQDLSMIHSDRNHPVTIGKYVTIGHGAILHGCTVHDRAVIGMGAVVLDGAVVGAHAVVAARALVTPGSRVPDGFMAKGVPATDLRKFQDDHRQNLHQVAETYIDLASQYSRTLVLR